MGKSSNELLFKTQEVMADYLELVYSLKDLLDRIDKNEYVETEYEVEQLYNKYQEKIETVVPIFFKLINEIDQKKN